MVPRAAFKVSRGRFTFLGGISDFWGGNFTFASYFCECSILKGVHFTFLRVAFQISNNISWGWHFIFLGETFTFVRKLSDF